MASAIFVTADVIASNYSEFSVDDLVELLLVSRINFSEL